jgi:hypothetical protein
VVANIFFWWYSEGLITVAGLGSYLTAVISNFFSLSGLTKTLFAPWRDDRLAADNVSLSDRVKIWEMNLVSRLIGFLVRSLVLVFALLIMGVLWLIVLLGITLWIALPWLPILLPILAIGVIVR